MVVFDCEDDEESRPAATGDGAFNFGCLGAVDCILYLVAIVLFVVGERYQGTVKFVQYYDERT